MPTVPANNAWIQEAKANANTIRDEISSLKSSYTRLGSNSDYDHGHKGFFKTDFKAFWEHAKRISDLFRNLKPLQKDDRSTLWTDFGAICESVKAEQAKANENRFYKSKQWKEIIVSEIVAARPVYAMGLLGPMTIDSLKAYSAHLKEAGRLLSEYKTVMRGEDKQYCFDLMQEVRVSLDAWWAQLKGQRHQRQQDFQTRVRANLEKNHERHRKASAALERARSHADDLRYKISDARSDEWRYRFEGWLSEAEGKIRNIEESIVQIEEWIREDELKLR